jgi:hypothetical protein
MVTNNGPTNATSVVLIDAFGANWKYISATEGQFTRSGSAIVFSLGSVAAGQTVTASVKAQPPEAETKSTVRPTIAACPMPIRTTRTRPCWFPWPRRYSPDKSHTFCDSAINRPILTRAAIFKNSCLIWHPLDVPKTHLRAKRDTPQPFRLADGCLGDHFN